MNCSEIKSNEIKSDAEIATELEESSWEKMQREAAEANKKFKALRVCSHCGMMPARQGKDTCSVFCEVNAE